MSNKPFHVQNQRRCIFCNGTKMSRTHIWPSWLNNLLAPPNSHLVELHRPERLNLSNERKVRQGSIFTQKPYLACAKCNTGWMGKFEDQMKKFSVPIFTSLNCELALSVDQQRIMAGWISLIAILAERIDYTKSSIVIPPSDLKYVFENKVPPNDWSIFATSSNANEWKSKYRHHTTHIGKFSSKEEYLLATKKENKPNTQISSFGMGNIFIQVFTCVDVRFVNDYREQAKMAGLLQIWPITSRILKETSPLEFPTNSMLDDKSAQFLADYYMTRIGHLTAPFNV